MDDSQLIRYSRQIMLPEVDIAGQQKLQGATVLVVGMGGLGCPVAMYLAAAGVGHLLLADHDQVELSNLQRQIAHGQGDVGRSKVASAADTLRNLNPELRLTPVERHLDQGGIAALLRDFTVDAVVDATDNFATRFAMNRACIEAGTPLVSGAAIRLEGQVTVFDFRNPASPCYECLYREDGEDDASCARNGVLAPLVGMIGTVQAMETVKLLLGIGETLTGRLLLLDAAPMQWRDIRLPRDPSCPACRNRHAAG